MTAAVGAMAQGESDSLRVEELGEVVVKAVKAQPNSPFAVSNIGAKELQGFSQSGRELPLLFSRTPGVLAWSENGLGTGTVYMRVRGAAGSRVNVTLDGVPLNSPEDQCVFWANMNSYGSLLGQAQIQRGVGTSTGGDGAFGGTVQLGLRNPSLSPRLELSASYGSYNTYNVGGSFSTGLLLKHLIIDGAYHETSTDGFVHGTAGRSGSYYGGLTWVSDRFVVRYKNIGNFEMTGQAWNGVTAGSDDLSLMDGTYGSTTGIKDYGDLYNRGLGRYNSLYESIQTDADGAFVTDANGNYQTVRHAYKNGYWDKTTDNFWQDHNILSLAFDISEHWTTTASLHYTYGYGYYKELRVNNKLSKFGLSNMTLSDGSTLKRTDFVRKKGLEQHTLGLVWNANYKDEHWDVIGGMSIQNFSGNHFGYLTYIANAELQAKVMKNGRYKYYDSDANKADASFFVKATRRLGSHFDMYADLQYRQVDFQTWGINDKFIEQADGTYANQQLNISKSYGFFNPKAGLSFHSGGHKAYASVALSHREPERNNFTDNGSYPAPKRETLTDYELGYSFTGNCWYAALGLYYMDYDNQFVQTGAQSDIGENLTTNIKTSYRMGVELQAGVDIAKWLSIEANAALSKNKIKDFDEVVEDWDNGSQTIHYDNSTLSFSPSAILNGFVNFHYKGIEAEWHSSFVSRQYLDNTETEARSLPAYSLSNLHLSYNLPLKKRFCGLQSIIIGADLNNVFNAHVATSGWVYSAIYESGGHPNSNRYYQIGYIPTAGFTAMGNLTLRF